MAIVMLANNSLVVACSLRFLSCIAGVHSIITSSCNNVKGRISAIGILRLYDVAIGIKALAGWLLTQ